MAAEQTFRDAKTRVSVDRRLSANWDEVYSECFPNQDKYGSFVNTVCANRTIGVKKGGMLYPLRLLNLPGRDHGSFSSHAGFHPCCRGQ